MCCHTPPRSAQRGSPFHPTVTRREKNIMPNRTRTQGVNIRLSDQEKKRLLRNARRCKLSVLEYIRQLVNGYEPAELPNDRFYELCWQMEQ